MFTRIISAAFLALAAVTPAWAAQPTNLELYRSVQTQVLRYSHFTVFDSVSAGINNGVVTLQGKVTMPYKRTDLAKRVAKVAGVTKVNNQIEVLPASRFDDELRIGIARALYSNSGFLGYGSMVSPPIHIIVDRGHVTLEGVVNNNLDRTLARSLVSGFQVFSLKNGLKTIAEAKAELESL